jgi:hypothetical protein
MYNVTKVKVELLVNDRKVKYCVDIDDVVDYEGLHEYLNEILCVANQEIEDQIYYDVPSNSIDMEVYDYE